MIVYKLNQQLNGQKILHDIQQLINQNHGEDYFLSIEVKKITYEDTSLIPKLEYKKEIQ